MGKRDDVTARLKAFEAYNGDYSGYSGYCAPYGGELMPLLKDIVTVLLWLADEDGDDGS